MKMHLFLVFIAGPLVFLKAPDITIQEQHAAATVAHLHDTMLDPASFSLDGVYVTKASKKSRRG